MLLGPDPADRQLQQSLALRQQPVHCGEQLELLLGAQTRLVALLALLIAGGESWLGATAGSAARRS